jgi:hypothetical protein
MRFSAVLIAAAAAVAAAAAFGFAAPATAPTLRAITPEASVGSVVTLDLTGSGLGATDIVPEVRDADGQAVAAGTVLARSATALTARFALAGARPGTYTVVARDRAGATSNGLVLRLSAEVGISPASGPPGTPFTYSGRGFTGRAGLTSHLEGRDGRIWQDKRIGASPEGTFEQTILSGEFLPGLYTVWASDDTTGLRTAPFTFRVTGPSPASPRP